MMLRRMVLVVSVAALALGQPAPAFASSCEDICGELAAKNCKKINSVSCGFYIAGCLPGCAVGKIVQLLVGDDE